MCFATGYLLENILLNFNFALRFYNCYIKLIESFSDWTHYSKGLWYECDQSNDEDVKIHSFTYNPDPNINYWTGSSLATPVVGKTESCFDINTNLGGFMPMYQLAMTYLKETYAQIDSVKKHNEKTKTQD